MKITLKLFATLSSYLPDEARQNAAELEVDGGMTPAQVIADVGLPREQVHLVLLNGIYLAEAEREQKALEPGDTLAIWPPVAGG